MDVAIPEIDLEHELQRFTTNFLERITQATDALESSPNADVRDAALRKNLVYASSAMDIATGPSAAVNLLDMVVFVHLAHRVLVDHWIPTLYLERGAALAAAFAKAEQELGDIALRALSSRDIARLMELADGWLADNPEQTNVEGVRLGDFASLAGAAASNRALQARGLLSSVKVATDAANKVTVLVERGMFFAHRLPFLLGLHVRLVVRDLVNDTLLRIKTGPELASVKHSARRIAYVAALGAATAGSIVWLQLRRRRTS